MAANAPDATVSSEAVALYATIYDPLVQHALRYKQFEQDYLLQLLNKWDFVSFFVLSVGVENVLVVGIHIWACGGVGGGGVMKRVASH